MLNQLETESFQRDSDELPVARRDLQSALAAASADWTARRDEGIGSAQESALDEAGRSQKPPSTPKGPPKAEAVAISLARCSARSRPASAS